MLAQSPATWTRTEAPSAPIARDVTFETHYRDVSVKVIRYSYGSASIYAYAYLGGLRLMVLHTPSPKSTDDELQLLALALVDDLLAAGFTAAAS